MKIIFMYQESVTLRNLWSQGCQVIISYEHNVANCHQELWSHIPYWWANKSKAEALIEEFERRKQNGRPGNYSFLIRVFLKKQKFSHILPKGAFFVTGINLTEDLKYICSHPTESLKDMVMSTYPTLLGWVRQQKPGSRTGSLNIIAGDFVTESKFIPTVIALNEHLLNGTTWSVFTMYLMFLKEDFFISVMDFFTSQVWQMWLWTCDE